ncbi:MAG: DUF2497 domain-containing protein [Methylobacterium mesophilicum]|nr:DUF2497 domain-containing protein [Methylobacterium mesophilicum]
MAQANASSAQREPSMEEILASIRRIIEDSDTVRGDAVRQPDEAQAAQPESVAMDDVEVFRTELGAARLQDETPPEEVKAEGPVEETAAVLPPEEVVAETPEASFIAHHDDEEAEPMIAEATGQELLEDAPSSPLEESDPMSQSVPQQSVRSFNGAVSHEAPGLNAVATPVEQSASAPLMSPQTGHQVAAAFSDLNEATQARARRSFDEIAEEMLRPMLREWLDNNLPHLVERLVREEIERIARGGAAPR